jgi:hypothetical protein
MLSASAHKNTRTDKLLSPPSPLPRGSWTSAPVETFFAQPIRTPQLETVCKQDGGSVQAVKHIQKHRDCTELLRREMFEK